MLNYNDLYEMLRKEKYSEQMQQLDKSIVSEFAEYLKSLRSQSDTDSDLYADSVL